jgi:hypothetical protein
MNRIQYPSVYIGTFFLLIVAVLAAVNSEASLTLLFFNFLFWPFIYGLGLTVGWYHRNKKSEGLLALTYISIGIAAVLFGVLSFSAGWEKGFLYFLICVQAGRNFTLSNRRDLYFAFTISLILILYAASLSKETQFIGYIVLYVLAGMFSLMAAYIDERLSYAKGGDKDILINRINTPIKGIGLTFTILILSICIYLIFPRLPSPHVQAFPTGGGKYYSKKSWKRDAIKGKDKKGEKEGDLGFFKDGQTPGGSADSEYDGFFAKGTLKTDEEKHSMGEGLEPKDPEISSDSEDAKAKLSHRDAQKKGDGESEKKAKERKEGDYSKDGEYGGFQRRFDICECGRPGLSNEIVFYLHADRPIYARGKIFDLFDGRIWEYSGFGNKKLYSKIGKFEFDENYQGKGTVQVYTIKRDLPDFIFSAYKPITLKFPGNVVEKGHALSLRAPDKLQKGTIYSVMSEIEDINGRISGGQESPGKEIYVLSGRYLQLPRLLSPAVRNLAVSITEDIHDDFGKAMAVEQYLKDTYKYTLDTIFRESQANPVEEFLFDLKKGHCELFASSMVVMLRSLKIPSRLVTGFRAHRYNPITGYYEVRGTDAHAWVESYIEDYGWVTFEPTPDSYLPQVKREYIVVSSLGDYIKDRTNSLIEANPNKWWAKLLQTLREALHKIYAFIEMILLAIKEFILGIFNWFIAVGWKFLLFTLVIAGIIYAFYLLLYPIMKKWKLKRLKEKDSGNFIFECYRNMERFFAKKGTPRPMFYTPFEYKELLKVRFGQIYNEIELITRVFEIEKYGPHPVSTEDANAAYNAYEHILKASLPIEASKKP